MSVKCPTVGYNWCSTTKFSNCFKVSTATHFPRRCNDLFTNPHQLWKFWSQNCPTGESVLRSTRVTLVTVAAPKRWEMDPKKMTLDMATQAGPTQRTVVGSTLLSRWHGFTWYSFRRLVGTKLAHGFCGNLYLVWGATNLVHNHQIHRAETARVRWCGLIMAALRWC